LSDYDVMVCGGGMAGLAAALTAAEHGATVSLAEKGDALGGSFALSGGLLWTLETAAELQRRLPRADHRLGRLVIDGLDDGASWLRSLGVKVGPKSPAMIGRGFRVDPREIIDRVSALLLEAGVRISYRLGLIDFAESAGQVSATLLDAKSGSVDSTTAGSLIIATGGFQGNSELLCRYIGVSAHDLTLRANPWSTGDGLSAVLRQGGMATAALHQFYGHALADRGHVPYDVEEYRTLAQYYGTHAVAVNLAGHRFTDESAGTGEENLNMALARQPDAVGYYIVDDRTARSERLPSGDLVIAALERARLLGLDVISADTLPELSDALDLRGVPKTALVSTLTEFNAGVKDGSAALYPPRMAHRVELSQPPYHAIRVRAAITFTTGGIAVDESLRVLRLSGSSSITQRTDTESRAAAFSNVFAAGVDVGGVSTDGYLGGIATSLVTGRSAGRHAAVAALALSNV
jgi:succinate dehydrogenase/fumarate reductase flavoprotein subunit